MSGIRIYRDAIYFDKIKQISVRTPIKQLKKIQERVETWIKDKGG